MIFCDGAIARFLCRIGSHYWVKVFCAAGSPAGRQCLRCGTHREVE